MKTKHPVLLLLLLVVILGLQTTSAQDSKYAGQHNPKTASAAFCALSKGLEASDSVDPDGDSIIFRWYDYPEAGIYVKQVEIERTGNGKNQIQGIRRCQR